MATPSAIAFAPEDSGAICAFENDRTLTWAELDDQSNRLASALVERGVRPGDVVAVRVRTRLEWPVVSLGIAKAGAHAVAVNYKLTASESTYILTDCRVRAAIVDDDDPAPLARAWAGLDLVALIGLDAVADGMLDFHRALAEADPAPRPTADFAPLIIYSSGTTGAPKGAPLGERLHRPEPEVLEQYLRSVNFDNTQSEAGSRLLMNLPMHHGAGPGATRSTLRGGGQVVFQRAFRPEQALALIARHRITHWIAVPTMLNRVVNLPATVRDRHDLSSLRFLLGGAAPFDQALKHRSRAVFGDILHEVYGCTEAGLIAGAYPADLRERPTSSGRPFHHVEVRIIDESGAPLPQGSSGEIAVRTPVIISGYVGHGPLGPDKLLPGGFYRTGDIGYLDADGYLHIHDRITDMVIAGGVNIYPAEIEAVLNTHPGVELTAVLGEPHPEQGEQVIAFVQPGPAAAVTADELLAYCEGRLAKYKWPRRIEFVESLPLSPMGKILKRELRAGRGR